MKSQSPHKRFIFNENIDSEFLYSLYEDDYSYVSEVFQTTLQHYDEDVQDIKTAYSNHNIVAVMKAVHKVKPVLGFTGLLSHQHLLTNFENTASKLTTTEELGPEYEALMKTIAESREIIESESKRLIEYTASNT